LAADQGSPEALSLLLERGANPNGGDPKWSPLRLVARHGLRQIVEKMISAGARVDARDYNNETALFWVARGGVTLREETVMAHLEGMKAPSYSSNGDFAGITELLIVRGSDVNALNKFRETPLHAAAKAGRTDVAEVLLRHAASLNARDRFGATPLWWAAEWGQAAYAKLLLDRGAEVDTPDEKGWTPLYCAARRGKADVTSVLIQHGADVNWKAAGGGFGLLREDFYTPLEAAATSGSAESVALLLKAGADPNIPKKHGRTALQCAIETSHMAIADTLRAHGARR
jgi:ankyrin repeat protein